MIGIYQPFFQQRFRCAKAIARARGFTIIELSIVLVVIGLVTGGVLIGRDVIRASQVQSVVGDATTYAHAVQQFQEKYGELPGDFSRATAIWGSRLPLYLNGNTDATMNGDGGGAICSSNMGTMWYVIVSGNPTAIFGFEDVAAWQHLRLGGFLDGRYTGLPGNVTPTFTIPDDKYRVPSVSVPGSSVPGGHFYFYSPTHDETFKNPPGADIVVTCGNDTYNLGTRVSANYNIAFSAFNGNGLEAAEAQNIDTKADDGKPDLGSILSANEGYIGGCVDDDGVYDMTGVPTTVPTLGSASYRASNMAATDCPLIFKSTFARPSQQKGF